MPASPSEAEARIILGLGSNLGDRLGHLRRAVTGLSRAVHVDACSPVFESDPVGLEDQPRFLNAVVLGRTGLAPAELLGVSRDLEAEAGRVRGVPGGPRTLDVDVLFFGDLVLDEPGLTVPHPRWHRRAFVLAPLVRVAPAWTDPVTGRAVQDVWSSVRDELPQVDEVAGPDSLWRGMS